MAEYPEVDRIARRQHGVVTTAQLAAQGLSSSQIMKWEDAGRLVRVRRGVYRLCGVAPSWRSAAMAAVLAAGAGAVLSHRSAGVLWGLLDAQAEGGPIEVTAPRLSRLEGVSAHRHVLQTGEVTTRHGVPVTSAARTLVDLGESVRDPRELGRLVDEALRRRLVTVGQLHAEAQAHTGPGRRYQQTIHAVLSDRIPGYDPGANEWERKMDEMWDRLGLPPAVRQHRIRTRRRTYRPDRAIVELKIAVDWNGYDAHGNRSQFDYDSERRADLAAEGWYPLDFTSRSSPESICRTVLAVVEERKRAMSAAPAPADADTASRA